MNGEKSEPADWRPGARSLPPQPQLEARAFLGARQAQVAAHAAGETAAESQSQTNAGSRAGGLRGRTVKGPEDPPPLARIDPRAVIVETEDRMAAL